MIQVRHHCFMILRRVNHAQLGTIWSPLAPPPSWDIEHCLETFLVVKDCPKESYLPRVGRGQGAANILQCGGQPPKPRITGSKYEQCRNWRPWSGECILNRNNIASSGAKICFQEMKILLFLSINYRCTYNTQTYVWFICVTRTFQGRVIQKVKKDSVEK